MYVEGLYGGLAVEEDLLTSLSPGREKLTFRRGDSGEMTSSPDEPGRSGKGGLGERERRIESLLGCGVPTVVPEMFARRAW